MQGLELEQKFNADIKNIIGNLKITKIALAVSGGVDSIALLLLTELWAKKNNIELTILTVDHSLRTASKLETQYVRDLSTQRGHKSYILDWSCQNNFSNLSERARIGRYRLMTNQCRACDILILLTAHHFNDAVENYYIRKKRKSGVLGLSLNIVNYFNDVMIARPLADTTKKDLIKYVSARQIKWYEDESNNDDKYFRNSIRKLIATEPKLYLAQFKQDQDILEKQAANINQQLIELCAEAVAINDYGFTTIDYNKFRVHHKEIKLRLLSYILNIVSGADKSPKASCISKIIECCDLSDNCVSTAHNCFIIKQGSKIIIHREFSKKIMPMDLELPNTAKWDNKFLVTTNKAIPSLRVSYMLDTDYFIIKDRLDLTTLKKLSFNNHKRILFTLPVFKILEKVVALPHISFYSDDNLANCIKISYQPNFISRFLHFY